MTFSVIKRGTEQRRVHWELTTDTALVWEQEGHTATLRRVATMDLIGQGWRWGCWL